MKREFLQNFKVGDQPLPKEIIDAIMDENGKDIEAAKAPFADYESIKEQLQTAKDGLKAFEGVDVAQLQGKITELQGQLTDKDNEWQGKIDAMKFESKVADAIRAAKGKNSKAITALLDMEALRGSKNQDADLKAALEALQQAEDSGFLFGEEQTPPGYASGTGGGAGGGYDSNAALRAAMGLPPEKK